MLSRQGSSNNNKVSRAVSLDTTISKKNNNDDADCDRKGQMRPLSHSGSSTRYSAKDGPLPESRSADSIQVNNIVEQPVQSDQDQNSASSKDALLDSEGAMALEPMDCNLDETENVKDRETDSRESEDVDSGCSECESVGSDIGDDRPNWGRKSKAVRTERYGDAVSEDDVKETPRPKSLPKEPRGWYILGYSNFV